MPDVDPIIQALLGNRQYPTDDPIAGIQPPLQVPKFGQTVPAVNTAPQPNQVMSVVGDLTGVNDAIKVLRGQMTPEEQQVFAATAAFGLIPGVGEMKPVAKAAEELAPPLYSAAAKAIQDARLTKGNPEQWLGYLRNQPGVKQEELNYMGALPQRMGGVTKNEMNEWATANGVQLKEITKSGNATLHDPQIAQDMQTLRTHGVIPVENPEDPGMMAFEAGTGDERDLVTSDEITEHPDAAQAARNIERHMAGGGSSNPTKFGNRQLPGGENYREMLMTLPPQQKDLGTLPAQHEAAMNAVDDYLSQHPQATPTNDPAYAQLTRNRDQLDNQISSTDSPGFRSSHWDEPNVIAHARMNDRMVPDAHGNPQKTLFLEELQSDWHQAGRRQGYKSDVPTDADITAANNSHNDLMSEMDKKYPNTIGTSRWQSSFSPEDQARYQASLDNRDALQNQQYAGKTAVPDAPFKQTWPDLMLKRMVRHAAENGYDLLAWTPGDVQADRYDLSKQLSKLQYEKGGTSGFTPPDEIDRNTSGTLKAYDPSGRQVVSKYVSHDELPDIIGKEAAQKLLAQTPTSGNVGGTALRTQTLADQDLKIGGEGMRAFYDKMLVDKANAIGKKYGARVTQTPMDVSKYAPLEQVPIEDTGKETKSIAAHVLPITPELKRAALTKGFPMFAAGGLTAGGLAAGQGASDPNAQMLNALRGQVSQPTPQQ